MKCISKRTVVIGSTLIILTGGFFLVQRVNPGNRSVPGSTVSGLPYSGVEHAADATAAKPGQTGPDTVRPLSPKLEEAQRIIALERKLQTEWKDLKLRFRLTPGPVWEEQVRRFEAIHGPALEILKNAGRESVTAPDSVEARAREEQGRLLEEKIEAAKVDFEKWYANDKTDSSLELAVHRWAREAPEGAQLLGEARRLSLLLHRSPPEEMIRQALLK